MGKSEWEEEMSQHARHPCIRMAPKGYGKGALLQAGCSASKVHHCTSRQGHLLSRVSTMGPCWWDPSTTKVGLLRLPGKDFAR